MSSEKCLAYVYVTCCVAELRQFFTPSKELRYDSVERFRADICGAIEQWAVSMQ